MGRHNGTWSPVYEQVWSHPKTGLAVAWLKDHGIKAHVAPFLVVGWLNRLCTWALAVSESGGTGGLSAARLAAISWPESGDANMSAKRVGALVRGALRAGGFLVGDGPEERIHDFLDHHARILNERQRGRIRRDEADARQEDDDDRPRTNPGPVHGRIRGSSLDASADASADGSMDASASTGTGTGTGIQKDPPQQQRAPHEPEPEQPHEGTPPAAKPAGASEAAKVVLDRWNEAAERVPHWQVGRAITGKRLTLLRGRLKEHGLDVVLSAIARAEQSPFLRGEVRGQRNGHEHWRPSLDWLLRPETVTRILEGQYEDRVRPNDPWGWVREEEAREREQARKERA